MDFRIFILALLLPIIRANQCDTCGTRVNEVFNNLKAEGESDATIQLLDQEICDHEPFRKQCSVRVRTWWPNMASIVFSANALSQICTEMSNRKCSELSWTCESCVDYVDQITEALTAESTLDVLIEALQGPSYCSAPKETSLKNDQEIEACQDFVAEFLPRALPIYLNDLKQSDTDHCSNWFNLNC